MRKAIRVDSTTILREIQRFIYMESRELGVESGECSEYMSNNETEMYENEVRTYETFKSPDYSVYGKPCQCTLFRRHKKENKKKRYRVQATLSDSKRARSLSPLKCASHSQAFFSLRVAYNGQLYDVLYCWKLNTSA